MAIGTVITESVTYAVAGGRSARYNIVGTGKKIRKVIRLSGGAVFGEITAFKGVADSLRRGVSDFIALNFADVSRRAGYRNAVESGAGDPRKGVAGIG